MSNSINRLDITKRATDAGWSLPDGWEVIGELYHEEEFIRDPRDDDEGLTATQVQAYRNDEWSFVYVLVSVLDDSGRLWADTSLGMCYYGYMPDTDEEDNVKGEPLVCDPLNDSTIADHDLIGEVLHEAMGTLDRLRAAIIAPPK